MKKIITIIMSLVFMLVMISCNNNIETTTSTNIDNNTIIKESENMNETLKLKINDTEVEVYWLFNEAVNKLKEKAKDGIVIKMNQYGGFEQVGQLGFSLPSNDNKITTNPGDIVLYSSNQIVLFYGTNTWNYTKLGHINLTKNELTDILGNEDVTITISIS